MRTLSAAHTAALGAQFRSERIRVEILQGATWRDMTTLVNQSWVDSVSISEDIDNVHATADVTLVREHGEWSLSPYMNTSGINRQFVYTGTVVPLIALNAQVRISCDLSTADATHTPAWFFLFHGKIVEYDASAGDRLTFSCRDMGSELTDRFIEKELQYCYRLGAAGTIFRGIRMFELEQTYAVGDYVGVIFDATFGTGHYYHCSTAGTSAASSPTWNTSGTTTSGSAVFTYQTVLNGDVGLAGWQMERVILQILADNGVSSHALWVDMPGGVTGVAIQPYKQQRESVMDALRNLVQQMGLDIRYKRNDAVSAWQLAVTNPDRTKTTPDYTFGPHEYVDITAMRATLADIRNVVRVSYRSREATPLSNGDRPVRTVTVQNAASIAKYGRLFTELGHDKGSNIDTLAEASRLANAVLSDLCEPTAVLEVDCFFFPAVELNDLYRFTGNGKHFDGDTDLAVTAFTHEFHGGDEPTFRTRLTCRGKPTGGARVWLENEGVRTGARIPELTRLILRPTLTATSQAGSVLLRLTYGAANAAANQWFEHDVHVSTTNNFTPTAGTFRGTFRGDSFTVVDLIPGETYYARVVSRSPNYSSSIQSEPTPAIQIVAGRNGAAHLNSDVNWGRQPLNGGFETRTDPAGMPDHWIRSPLSLGRSVTVREGADALSGIRCLEMTSAQASTAAFINSGVFEVMSGQTYVLSVWRNFRVGTANDSMTLGVFLYGHDGGLVAYRDILNVLMTDSPLTWKESVASFTALGFASEPVKTARVVVTVDGFLATTRTAWIDSVSAYMHSQPQQPWVNAALLNDYVSLDPATFGAVGYMKDSSGIVHLRGQPWRYSGAGIAADGTVIFNLPSGYRPAFLRLYRVYHWNGSNALQVTINVHPNGDVTVGAGHASNYQIDLSAISFRGDGT